ncbi:hypothetical protein N323_04879, partial [Cathartes aura]
QAVGNAGPINVKVLFSLADLNNLKATTGKYRDHPETVASAFEIMIKTQDPDWNDIEAIMQALFDSTEKEMIRRAARTHVEGQIASGILPGTVEAHFPSVEPQRDPNNAGDRRLLTQYQRLVSFGVQNAIPKTINWSKLY